MAGRTMDVSVLVRLVDRLTGPLRAVQSRLAGFAAFGQRIGLIGALVAGISFMAPINSAAQFDQKLRESVVTAGYWGDAAEKQIRRIADGVSQLALQVGIASSQLADARGLLIAGGMEETLVDRLLPTIGRVSKAASAVPDDVAKVAGALTNSLGVSSDQIELAFAKLITAGKLGRFEFRNMARELPELASQFTKFKIAGMEAVETLGASLQVAMFGTDDTRAAANNFKNFLSKVLAPDAVKNFKEMGVDILGVMQSAAAQGVNPIEAAVQKVLKLTGVSQKQALAIFNQKKSQGLTDAQAMAQALEQIKAIAGAGKLSNIFGDMQVLDFLLPMLANIDKYQEFRKEIAASGLDVIARDFATQMEGLTSKLAITGEIGEQAVNRIGIAFGSNLRWINAWGIAALGWVREIDARFPGLIDMMLSWGGAVLVAIASLALMVPVLSILSAAFGVLAALVGLVLTPIGLLVAAFAGLAYLIYSEWADFAPFFTELWDGVKQAFSGGWQDLQAGASRAGTALLAILGRTGSRLLQIGDRYFGGWPSRILAAVRPGLGRVEGAARQFGSGLVSYLRGLFTGDWTGMIAGLRDMARGASSAWSAVLGVFTAAGPQLRRFADTQLGGLPGQILNIIGGIWIAMASAVSTLAGRAGEALEPIGRAVLEWARDLPGRIARAFGENGAAALAWLKDLGASVTDTLDQLSSMSDADWANLGTRLGNALADSVRDAVNGLASFFTGLPARILDWVGSIDIGSLIKWPSFGGPPGAPGAPANENAPATDPMGNPTGAPAPQRQGFAPAPQRFASAASLAPGGRGGSDKVGGEIIVRAERGTQVAEVRSTNAAVPLKADNGRMIGRV